MFKIGEHIFSLYRYNIFKNYNDLTVELRDITHAIDLKI